MRAWCRSELINAMWGALAYAWRPHALDHRCLRPWREGRQLREKSGEEEGTVCAFPARGERAAAL